MRAIYILILTAVAGACSSMRDFSNTFEDDIYYVPGKSSLFVKEIERKTGQKIVPGIVLKEERNHIDPALLVKEQEEANSGQVNPRSHAIGMARYATEKQVKAAQTETNNQIMIDSVAGGYWMGGFKGSEQDLEECVRIMNRYPEGFAYFGNGHEIAMNLSFSLDWNVYTVNNRYWWFPSNTNFELYTTLIFGTYPKYIWTVMWNDPHYDSFVFDRQFASGIGIGSYHGNPYWWNNWGWHGTIGWNSYWNGGPYWSNPFWYDHWGWYHGWGHDPWYYSYWNGYWGPYYPHWTHRPGYHPNVGGVITHPSTHRSHYATRAHYTGNRSARTYSSYTRSSRSSTYNRNTSNSRGSSYENRNSHHNNPGYSDSGKSSRGNSSYGRNSTTRTGSGSGTVKRSEHRRSR